MRLWWSFSSSLLQVLLLLLPHPGRVLSFTTFTNNNQNSVVGRHPIKSSRFKRTTVTNIMMYLPGSSNSYLDHLSSSAPTRPPNIGTDQEKEKEEDKEEEVRLEATFPQTSNDGPSLSVFDVQEQLSTVVTAPTTNGMDINRATAEVPPQSPKPPQINNGTNQPTSTTSVVKVEQQEGSGIASVEAQDIVNNRPGVETAAASQESEKGGKPDLKPATKRKEPEGVTEAKKRLVDVRAALEQTIIKDPPPLTTTKKKKKQGQEKMEVKKRLVDVRAALQQTKIPLTKNQTLDDLMVAAAAAASAASKQRRQKQANNSTSTTMNSTATPSDAGAKAREALEFMVKFSRRNNSSADINSESPNNDDDVAAIPSMSSSPTTTRKEEGKEDEVLSRSENNSGVEADSTTTTLVSDLENAVVSQSATNKTIAIDSSTETKETTLANETSRMLSTQPPAASSGQDFDFVVTSTPKLLAANSIWSKFLDPPNKVFYYNRETGVTQYEAPKGVSFESDESPKESKRQDSKGESNLAGPWFRTIASSGSDVVSKATKSFQQESKNESGNVPETISESVAKSKEARVEARKDEDDGSWFSALMSNGSDLVDKFRSNDIDPFLQKDTTTTAAIIEPIAQEKKPKAESVQKGEQISDSWANTIASGGSGLVDSFLSMASKPTQVKRPSNVPVIKSSRSKTPTAPIAKLTLKTAESKKSEISSRTPSTPIEKLAASTGRSLKSISRSKTPTTPIEKLAASTGVRLKTVTGTKTPTTPIEKLAASTGKSLKSVAGTKAPTTPIQKLAASAGKNPKLVTRTKTPTTPIEKLAASAGRSSNSMPKPAVGRRQEKVAKGPVSKSSTEESTTIWESVTRSVYERIPTTSIRSPTIKKGPITKSAAKDEKVKRTPTMSIRGPSLFDSFAEAIAKPDKQNGKKPKTPIGKDPKRLNVFHSIARPASTKPPRGTTKAQASALNRFGRSSPKPPINKNLAQGGRKRQGLPLMRNGRKSLKRTDDKVSGTNDRKWLKSLPIVSLFQEPDLSDREAILKKAKRAQMLKRYKAKRDRRNSGEL